MTHPAPPPPDEGLDSAADLRIFTHILLFGVVAVVVAAAVAFLITGDVALVGLLVGSERVDKLVLVEVDDCGQPPHAISAESQKLGQIEHVGGEQDIPLLAGGLLLADQFGDCLAGSDRNRRFHDHERRAAGPGGDVACLPVRGSGRESDR